MTAAVSSMGAVVVLIGTFLPWLHSGGRARSSYALFEVVERLGFERDGIVGLALRVWPLAPLLLVLSFCSQWWPGVPGSARRWLPVASAVYVGAVAIGVMRAPGILLFRTGSGPIVVVFGAAMMLTAMIVESFGWLEGPRLATVVDQPENH